MTSPPEVTPMVEWVKALAPMVAAIVIVSGGAIVGFFLNRRLEAHKSDLNKTVERHKVELGAVVQEKLEADRRESSRALEGMRAELALVGRLHTTRAEKRSEVAAEVLLATLDLMDAVRTAASQIGLEGDPDRQEGEDNKDWLARQHAVRWAKVNKVYRRFMRRYARAEVYLPDEATEILSKARKLQRSIEVDQQMFCIFHGGDQYFSKGWGSKPRKEAEAMRAEVKSVLRPYAQLTDGVAAAPGPAVLPALDGKPPPQRPPVKPTDGDEAA